jgi:small redox-active disulfide protein 2
MRIQIVGAGCPACRNLEKDVRAWLAQQQIEAHVERVDDLVEIMKLGLLALPGLLIDDHLVLTGYPPRSRLDKTLREAFSIGVSWHNR